MKKDVNETVLEFIKSNPGSSAEAITVGTKCSNILVLSALKTLQKSETINADGDTGTYSFNSKEKTTPESVSKPAAQKAEAKNAKKDEGEDLGPKLAPGATGRDGTRYSFNNIDGISKSRLVLAVMRQFASDNSKMSITKIQETFKSSELQPRFGLIRPVSEAKEYTKGKINRFFLAPEDLLVVGTKRDKAAICNQWSLLSVTPFIKLAKEQGYTIKVSK